MNQFKVFVARKIPEIGISLLNQQGIEVEINEDGNRILSKSELIEKIQGKDALLSLFTDKIDKGVIKSNQNLKIISNYAVGFDNIDVESATKNGIIITNTPDVLNDAVAEHTLALMIAAARRIVEANRFTREGKYKGWEPSLFLGMGLKGKTLGIIGLGRIGLAVAERAIKGLGMKVIHYSQSQNTKFEQQYQAKFVDLETLLKESDFISLHVPLTKETRHLISTEQFEMMKATAILINNARGPIVDEEALIDALVNKKIFAAALDVFECEPDITCDDCRVQLKDLDNVILTPHIASATMETRNKMAEIAAQNIIDFSRGKIPKHVVNKEIIEKYKRKKWNHSNMMF